MTNQITHIEGTDELRTYLIAQGKDVVNSDNRNEDLIATIDGVETTYRVAAASSNGEGSIRLDGMIEDLSTDFLAIVIGVKFTIRKIYIMPTEYVKDVVVETDSDNFNKYIDYVKFVGYRVKTW